MGLELGLELRPSSRLSVVGYIASIPMDFFLVLVWDGFRQSSSPSSQVFCGLLLRLRSQLSLFSSSNVEAAVKIPNPALNTDAAPVSSTLCVRELAMSKADETRVSELLSQELGLELSNRKYYLNGWGEADNFYQISDDKFLVLEVETSQKHPSTNVLKLWPYMEENIERSIVLIQTFFPDSPGLKSNRGKLSAWVASKMSESLLSRFYYFRLVVSKEFTLIEGLSNLTQFLEQFANDA